jgi:hypothetical protein
MGSPKTDFHLTIDVGKGKMIWQYDARHDVVTLEYEGVVLETDADVAAFVQAGDVFWKRFDADKRAHERKDLLVDMSGLVVKPTVATAWNAARGYMVQRYLRNTYRFSAERRTATAVHLGQVLQKVDGTIYASRDEALTALLADRAAQKKV